MSAVHVMPLLGADSAQLRLMGALMRQARASGTWPPPGPAQPPDPAQPAFTAIAEDHYRYTLPQPGIALDLDRVRRDRGELRGELSVRCERQKPGRPGIGITGDFVLGSIRSRAEWIRLLEERTKFAQLDFGLDHDWFSVLEGFCARVRQADRESGEQPVDLRTVSPAADDELLDLEGLRLPLRHPSMLFADGGSAKSYYGLRLLGNLALRGERVALFDWELDQNVHRKRLELLFGPQMPLIWYVRCVRPLVDEADRLRRFVKEKNITFSMFDSVAKACDGAPEAAEVAGRYQRAVRMIGGGSLHIAHVTKSGEDQKPFGSVFWHNDARATWFARALPDLLDETVLHMAIYNRKVNLGSLAPDIGFAITFGDRTTFAREEVDDGKIRKLTVRQQMIALLCKEGDMFAEAIAGKIGAKLETVKRTARRHKDGQGLFVVKPDGRIGLDPENKDAWIYMRETTS
jgi:hypothetical protein